MSWTLVIVKTYIREILLTATATWPSYVPGGYRALYIGAATEGILGGFFTLMGALHAYISDVTDEDLRAAAFSVLIGIATAGTSLGLLPSAFLISKTGNL